MSGKELGFNPAAEQQQVVAQEIILADPARRTASEWLRDNKGVATIVSGIAAGAMLLSACSSASSETKQTSAQAMLTATTEHGSDVTGCIELKPFNVSATPPSIFGQMYVQKNNGNQANFPPNKASDQIRARACYNRLPLAVLDSIYEIYQNVQTPSNLEASIQNNYANFVPGSEAAKTAEQNVVNFATLMNETTPSNPFVIDTGASAIEATTDGFSISRASLGNGTAEGYTVAANNQNLSAAEQKRINDLASMFVFTTDGRVIVNETLATTTINEQSTNQSSGGGGGQSPNANATSQNSGNEKGNKSHGTGSSNNEGQSPSAAGTTGNSNNSGGGGAISTGNGTGNTGNGTGNGGAGSGNGGEGGGGGNGGTTPGNTIPTPSTTPPPTYPKTPVTTTTISGLGNPIGGS